MQRILQGGRFRRVEEGDFTPVNERERAGVHGDERVRFRHRYTNDKGRHSR